MPPQRVNDIALHIERTGTGEPLLLLHGFTGSARTWDRFRGAWPGMEMIALDLIGHGQSDAPKHAARYRMAQALADLSALLDALAMPSAVVLGYSLGGRVALRWALAQPQRVRALILESATPGIADKAERAQRRSNDNALADRIERDGVERFVDYWESMPLWASQARLPQAERSALRTQRLQNRALGLANSLRGMGAGVDAAVLADLDRLTMPALLVAGALDNAYCAHAKVMAARLPKATVSIVPDAGHAVHLERPQEFASALGAFLAGLQA